MVLLNPETSPEDLNSSSVMNEDVLQGFTKQRTTRLVCSGYGDETPTSQLPPDRGVLHKFVHVPVTKYCVMRQWPLPLEHRGAGVKMPAFCVRKPNGKWRLVHAYNNLNGGSVPAFIPHQEVLLNKMSGYTLLELRVKPSVHASAPLQSLPVPADCWKSMSLDFVFGLPDDDKGNTGILVVVCRLSKMVHIAPDGQTECVNRVLEDTLRSISAEAPQSWSDQMRMVEFALNNAVHASTGFTPFYLNGLRHPQVPLTSRGGADVSIVSGRKARKAFSSQVSEIEPETLKRQLPSFIGDRLTLMSLVRDTNASE
ncbi:reverse transcriptase [Phytophthora palmivora]|uniref:Reverse transcriptase n=1 Tax=Phytophthora palmivora TaxID=4796 RepID=A0A2P4X301_9STRA|nr:reverse transcriptase [Phytophthora palmivora]